MSSSLTDTDWHGKPYYSLDAYCKNTFGEKLYKIALRAGFSCPNRDGTIGKGGCLFCSEGGSGEFAAGLSSPAAIHESLLEGQRKLAGKKTGQRFIAYFQAYTNTYGPLPYLRSLFWAALTEAQVAGISIATRPDCLPPSVLSLLGKLQEEFPDKFIWVELGLQTIKEQTALYIRRGYSLSCFEEATAALSCLGIPVITHLILGLPGESREDMLASLSYLNTQPIWGVKLQLLHILKGTDLAQEYLTSSIPDCFCFFQGKEAYASFLAEALSLLRPDLVIHRLTGDAPRALLLAPSFSTDKRGILNTLHKQMKEQGLYQGCRLNQMTGHAGAGRPCQCQEIPDQF